MKFLKFKLKNNNNRIKSGYYDGNEVIELKSDLLNYFNSSKKEIKENSLKSYKLDEIEIESPVEPSKIVCIGLNYKDHAEELKMELPDTPKLFIKPSTTIIGNEKNIISPEMSDEISYEGELAIIIGKQAKNIEIANAKDYIFGYSIINDVTARDVQRYDEQWTRAKSFDTFAPLGPFIETEMDPMNQKIITKVNGEIKQDSNTKNMIFSPYDLLSFISKVMTLYPGDVIATGTPPGVGRLNNEDIVEIAIEDIGILKNRLTE